MSWAISFVLAVLLGSLTGSCLFVVWYSVGKLLEKMGRINVMYELLKVVLAFWYLPLTYIVFYNANYARWGGFLFRRTDDLELVCRRVCTIWGIGLGLLIIKYFVDSFLLKRRYRNSFPIDDAIYDYFESVCEELGIKKNKVDLVFDYKASAPCIGGLIHNYVVLPNLEYSGEQLRVIFLHELTHYKQKNHVLRHFTQIAFAIHFFNPMMWIMKWLVRYWGEYACDFEVIPKTSGADYYFDVIKAISSSPSFAQMLDSRLFESDDEIEKRKALAKRSYKMKTKSRVLTLAVVLVMSLTSTITVEASTRGLGELYYNTYFATVEDSSEVVEGTDGVEYVAPGFEQGVVVTKEKESLFSRSISTGYSWSIRAKRAQSSRDFSAKAGQTISMTAIVSPNTSAYRMGIIQPDGTLRYVNGKGAASHNFALTQTGTYAIYVQNMSDVAIDVDVLYHVE